MKKLMIALAAAATTMLSFGAGTAEGSNRTTFDETFGKWTGTSFEALTEGSVNVGDIVGKDDTGNQDGENKFWYSAATETDELGTITNEVAGAGVSRPDAFAKQNQANTKSLQIDTTSPLFRTALPNSSGVQPVDIGDGIYLDTLVKFTAADEVFGTNALEAVDKIAIEYVEREADETAGITALTNFVVRAGFIGSELFTTNYAVELPAGWIENNKKDDWHRLTVRALLNIDGQNRVGFKIYLDENVLSYVTDNDEFAKSSGIDDDTHTIFPSAVETDKNNYSDISSVAFSGSGFIDDVVFTTEVPEFIKNSESVPVAITLGTGVADVTVTPYDSVTTNDTTLVFNLPAGTTSFVLAVTADTANGYTFDETTGITLSNATYDDTTDTVTITGGSPALTVVGKRDNFDVYVSGVKTGSYSTLSAALTGVEDGSTIKLAYNYAVGDFESAGFTTYGFAGKSIVLDLNGKVLDGGSSNDNYLFAPGEDGELTVIDSGTGGKIVYGGTKGMFNGNVGDVFIGSTTLSDNGATFDGVLMGAEGWVSRIWRGKFSYDENTDDGVFVVLPSQLASGSTATHEGDYWVVAPEGGSEPTEIAVPTAESNLVYNGTEQTGVAAGTGYTLTGVTAATDAGEYTATATPVSGYAWVGGSTDATNITWSIAKVELNAVTVTLDPASATYDSEKDEVTDYTTPSVNFGLGAPALVENTDYTVAWSATEVSGAGTFTYTVSPVADSNYTFTETSATLTITAGGEYPTYIEDLVDGEAKTAYEKKYDDWKATYGADTESAFGAAFLLNIDPAAADQTLEPVSITMEGGKVVISANQTLTAVNGKVYVKVATTLAGLATAEWTEATLDEGKVQVTPGSSDTAGFYKIKVDF